MDYKNFASKIGFEDHEGIFVNEKNGFSIYLKDWQYLVLTIKSFYIPLNKPLTTQNIKEIEKETFNTACGAASLGERNDVLIVTLPEGDKESEKFIKSCNVILTKATEYLLAHDFLPMCNCPICKKEAQKHKFMDNYIPIHKECKEEYKNKLLTKIQEQEGFKPNYIVSILLSTIFGLIGALPPFLLTIYENGYFTGLLALIPILVFLGFFLSKAPNKKWLVITTSLISFAIVLAVDIYTLPFIAKAKELSFIDCYFKSVQGVFKIIFSTIFCFIEFGIFKYYKKFKPDLTKQLNLLNKE